MPHADLVGKSGQVPPVAGGSTRWNRRFGRVGGRNPDFATDIVQNTRNTTADHYRRAARRPEMASHSHNRGTPSDIADTMDAPVHVFTPESGMARPLRLFAESMHDLWTGRELAWRMFVRNIQGLYRQTFLGLFWAFLPPLANTLVWLLLRRAGAIDLAEGIKVHYALYVMTGMVIWQSFTEALQAPLQVVNANRNMLSKLRFPRESILLVGILEVLFNLVVRLVVLFPLLLIFGTTWSASILASPLIILVLILLGLALGLFLMPFGMLYQDVGRVVAVAVPVWMIVTPIVYGTPPGWNSNPLNWLNPASPLLTLARDLMLFGSTDVWPSALVYAAITLPLLAVGLLFYRLSIPILVERISS
jgi:lipopolysaccharide transport system permease protein